MDLEAVTQDFVSDMTRYLAGMDAAIARAVEFATASKEAEDAVASMALAADDAAVVVVAAMNAATGAVRDLAGGFARAGAATGVLRGGLDDVDSKTAATVLALADLDAELDRKVAAFTATGAATAVLTGGLDDVDVKVAGTIASLVALDLELDKKKAAMAGLALGSIATAGAVGAAGGAAARAGAGFRFFGIGIRLGATAIHGIISGLIEFLAVAIPATVAAGAWAAVWMQGAANVAQHMRAVYIATEATANIFHVTAGQAVGLGDALQKAQDAANPNVYQALGSAVLLVNEKFGHLAQTGLEVGRIFDTFAAKVVYDFSPSGGMGGAMDAVLSKMVTDLVQFGQVLGNLGHAILLFGAKMPGAANLLLDFLVAVTRVIVAVSQLPRPILYAVFALHEFNTWGSVFVAITARMGLANVALEGSFFGLGRAIGVFRVILGIIPALLANFGAALNAVGLEIPVIGAAMATAGDEVAAFGESMTGAIAGLSGGWILAIAAIAVGLGILIDKLATSKTAAQQFADSLQAAADKASNLQVLGVLASNMEQFASAEHAAAQGAGTLAAAQAKGGGAVRAWASAQMAAGPAMAVMRAGLESSAQQFQAVAAHAQSLAATYHTSLYGALNLADLAGVKLNQTMTAQAWAIAQIKVQSLVAGYQAMGQSAGAVGQDMTALAIQSGLAATQVDKLNQAWDAFMADITGGTSGLAAFNQALSNLSTGTNTVTNILGKAGSVSLSMKDFAQSLTSFSGKGAQAWQNFNQVVGSTAPQLTDWLRTAGAMGVLGGNQFSHAVLDMAASLVPFASKSKVAQAEVLALAQQAGLGITTFPQLEQAIKSSGASAQNLSKIVGATTIAMGNMSKVAQNLGTVMSSQVTAGLAAAALKAVGFDQAVNAATAAIQKYGAGSPQALAALSALQGKLSTATSMALTLAKGVSAATSSVDSLILAISGLHGKTVYVNVVGNQIAHHAAGTPSAAPGVAVVGEEGPELVVMRGGEQVITAQHTRALLGLAASARHMQGYAAGTQSSAQLMSQLTRELSVLAMRLTAASSISGISQYLRNLLSTLKQLASAGTISKSSESGMVALIGADNKRLDHLFTERAKILAKIKKADQYAAAVSQAAQSSASLSTIMQGAGGAPVSSSYLLASMRIDLAGIRRFDADIRKLERMGLDRALLNQIIQMGPAQGDQVAQALISGPLSNIKALNATESQVQKASKNLGRTTADRMFDAGRYAGKGFLSGLEGEQHAIERLMEKIARDMVRTLKKELGIHSDSAVTRAIGQHVVGGLASGITSRLPSLDSSLRSAAGHVTSALSSAAGGSGGGGDIVIHNHVLVPLPGARQQYQEVQAQTLRVNRRNPDNRLSLTRGRGGR